MAKRNLPSYKASGKLGPLTLALFAGVAVGAIVGAVIYQLIMNWIPIIQIKFLATLAFGGGLGAAAMFAVHRGHCRNALVAGVLALAVAGLGLFASHYWNYQSAISDIIDKQPNVTSADIKADLPFGKYLDLRKEMGWSMKRGGKVEGGMVTFLWILEALIVVGLAGFMAAGAAAKPYCESCQKWCDDKSYTIWGVTSADANPLIERGDLTALADISGKDNNPTVNLTFKVEACPSCTNTGFLTLHEKRVTTDKKGRRQEKGAKLLSSVTLTAEQLAHARDRASFAQGQKLPG